MTQRGRWSTALVHGASLTLVLLLAAGGSLAAQTGVVALLVIDDATDAAVPDVRVSIAGEPGERVTDGRGRLVYVVPKPGRVAFILRRLGYMPGSLVVDVPGHDTALVTFAMTAMTQRLATVEVRDTMTSTSPFLSGFERRVRNHAGSATYITRSEIERLHPSQVTDLFRRITSVRLNEQTGAVVTRRMQRPDIKGGMVNLADCPLRVALDGQLKEPGYALNSLAPEEIHGMEVYPGPSAIPAEYATMGRDGACGLIVIWTRRDK